MNDLAILIDDILNLGVGIVLILLTTWGIIWLLKGILRMVLNE